MSCAGRQIEKIAQDMGRLDGIQPQIGDPAVELTLA
jgi:hypothetical protein